MIGVPFIYIANWKMNVSFCETEDFLKNHGKQLAALVKKSSSHLVIVPSFESLSVASLYLQNSLLLGAQDCSEHKKGAYTGQVSARSLAELHCSYCMVGHSESRYLCQDGDDVVQRKVERLFDVGITPIVCVASSSETNNVMYDFAPIKKRLESLGL